MNDYTQKDNNGLEQSCDEGKMKICEGSVKNIGVLCDPETDEAVKRALLLHTLSCVKCLRLYAQRKSIDEILRERAELYNIEVPPSRLTPEDIMKYIKAQENK